MIELDANDIGVVLKHIQAQAQIENLRVTLHAQQEMVEDAVTLDDVLAAIATGTILENYPQHQRSACCLINGQTKDQRYLHIVCTSTNPTLIIITVYEPKPPKWPTPIERRRNDEM